GVAGPACVAGLRQRARLAPGGAVRRGRPAPLRLRAVLPAADDPPVDLAVPRAVHARRLRVRRAGLVPPGQGAGDPLPGPRHLLRGAVGERAHAEAPGRGGGRFLAFPHGTIPPAGRGRRLTNGGRWSAPENRRGCATGSPG